MLVSRQQAPELPGQALDHLRRDAGAAGAGTLQEVQGVQGQVSG